MRGIRLTAKNAEREYNSNAKESALLIEELESLSIGLLKTNKTADQERLNEARAHRKRVLNQLWERQMALLEIIAPSLNKADNPANYRRANRTNNKLRVA